MCGIVGFLRLRQDWPEGQLQDVITRMSACLAHRGPDSDGHWQHAPFGLAFGQRRLAIIDLSPAGHQPMMANDGKAVIILNGEIYNFPDLRSELEAVGATAGWRGHSDTEVLLVALRHFGLQETLKKLNGMYAFAYADLDQKKLYLARDRFGEKPLYIYRDADSLAFASELKAFKKLPEFDRTVDTAALAEFMAYAYVPQPRSIYEKAKKLPPGCYAEIDLTHPAAGYHVVTYWSARDHAVDARKELMTDEAAALQQLDDIARRAVNLRMISDVPLGAFLSGGIDSSTVVALMQAQSSRPVKTYSIGFAEEAYNEAPHAREVANHLGTEHTEQIVTADEAMAVIPYLPQFYDEPFADSSQIPTYLVAKLARQHVTVSLSGDAGDELFGGYNRYFIGAKLWKSLAHFPQPLRALAAKAIIILPPAQIDAIFGKAIRSRALGDKAHKLAGLLDAADSHDLYRRLLTFWPLDILNQPHHGEYKPVDSIGSFTDDMMLHDTVNYLPDDILAKLDRACMAVSLEGRVPFLDPELYDFAWSLAPDLKIRNGQGKYLLRQLLYKYVPQQIVDRPKMGFGLPVGDWLRGPLRDWAEELLSERALELDGALRSKPIIEKWQDHLSGHRNWQYHLWPVLMYQAWRQAQN